jgi:hypothetical protein
MKRNEINVPFSDLEDEYLRRKSLLDELRQTRSGILQNLETVDARILAVEEGRELYVGNKLKPPAKKKTIRLQNSMSVAEYGIDLITKNGPMTARQVAQGALAGGYQTVSTFDVFVCSVSSCLRFSSRFVKDGKLFRLSNET